MRIEENLENEFQFEQFIAGVLLRFDSIDNVDMFLLLLDFNSKSGMSKSSDRNSLPNLFDYVTREKNGIYKINDSLSLDSVIEVDGEKITLRDYFTKISSGAIYDYFMNLDIDEYKMKKDKILSHNKNLVANNANVLLISDRQEDYDEMVKYGFKNIDYFKSIIRADRYFEEHPEELEKYHIILEGNHNVTRCCLDGHVKLSQTLGDLAYRKRIIHGCMHVYKTCYDEICASILLEDYRNNRNWKEKESSYSELYDKIVENAMINDVFSKVSVDSKFIAHEDYINPERLSLPSKKADLKILYLGKSVMDDQVKNIYDTLGINIDFYEDNNAGLGRHVKENLGNYDIIIVSESYSGNILGMNIESTEQCKDTGRELTLLVTYDTNDINESSRDIVYGVGSHVTLSYIFGGNYSDNSAYSKKKFKTIIDDVDLGDVDVTESWKEYHKTEYSNMKTILESAINIYNDYIQKIEKGKIEDLDLRDANSFELEYSEMLEKEKAKLDAELVPIDVFDKIKFYVLEYFLNIDRGLIDSPPEGLRIYETDDGITVENVYNNRVLCTVKFEREHRYKDMRVFDVQTLSNKGKLLPPQTVGVYTRFYENKEGTPNRPDEKQLDALFALQKKIRNNLKPVIDEAYEKRRRQHEQEEAKWSYKKKKRKTN